jgi:periplasmic protein TonB
VRAAPRSPAAQAPHRAAWLAIGLSGSAALHAAALAALLFWPSTLPEPLNGEGESVALVFADTVALEGGGGDPPPPAAPPAPTAPPAPPAALAPPPEPPTAPAPPAEPLPPGAPQQFAALPPPAPPVTRDAPAPQPPAMAEPMVEAPAASPPPPSESAPPPAPAPPPREAAPTPPPREATPARPPARAPTPPPASQPRAAAEQVRLGAGGGALPDPSLGARAIGAVVPPGAADGYRNAPPEYPPDSRRRGEEGVVRLSLSIGTDGRVAEASVAASSGHPALDAAAVAAARRWRFRPATQAGLPVPATVATAVQFRLTEGERR